MKKYIISLMTLSCTMFQANAMEIVKPSDSETVEQFIERTRVQPALTPECKKLFEARKLECERYSFSPDETKLLAVAKEENSSGLLPFYLMRMNLHKKHGITPDLTFEKPLTFALNLPEYNRIALSSENNMIATFYENIWWQNDGRHSEYVFKVKKIEAKKNDKGEIFHDVIDEQKIDFSYDFYPTIIAFNKQGTLLIARDGDQYQLFEVKC